MKRNSRNIYDKKSPFRSFWMGGYECSDKLNAFGNRVDLLKDTGHLQLLHEDYRQLKNFNIRTVREGIRWSQVEKTPYTYDWSTVEMMIKAARQEGIQQIWDLCHFGFPDDLTPLHPMFARRFAALCRNFVNFYRTISNDTLIVTPINEVSFLSWLGGDARGTAPYCIHLGWEVKYYLMKAYIEGVAAIKEMDPNVLILSTEPLVHIVPPFNASEEEIAAAAQANEDQYQAMDMLTGRICPELGGRPEFMDIAGFNFYYNNRWEIGHRYYLPWINEAEDPRWLPLSDILLSAYSRYECPFILAETSHSGEHRPNWINHIGEETAILLDADVPFQGVCIYPIIDRPDWDHGHWHHSGLWDETGEANGFERILNEDYAAALLDMQEMTAGLLLQEAAC
jgi:hypothetical protein